MIAGVGTDILHMDRLKHIIHDLEDPFFTNLFTEKEKVEGLEQINALQYFSGRFAGKEAVFKTFKVHGDTIHLKDIEILKTKIGYPMVYLHGKAKEIAAQKKITSIELSLSYDTDYVVAYAIAMK